MHTFFWFLSFLTSIYTHQVTAMDGQAVGLGQYAGKKILIVNTATNSPSVGQYGRLEQLHQLMGDSLVIIALPSNSFGHEPGSDGQIDSLVRATYDVHYLLGRKVAVSGAGQAPLYHWLTTAAENGSLSNPVGGDFYKYLVNEQGMLVGVFSSKVDPLSEEMLSAVRSR